MEAKKKASKKVAKKRASKKEIVTTVGKYTPRVGDKVSYADTPYRTVTGVIGEVDSSGFYIWQNEHDGSSGGLNPKLKGFKFSWYVGRDETSKITIHGTSKLKTTKLPKVNFILQYMLDEDPWETFSTIEEVKARINELVNDEDNGLQMDSFVIYDVSRVRKLKVEKTVDISGL